MKYIALLPLALVLLGCAPYRVSVYGASGRAYTAPDLCAAQIACRKGNDLPCYYNATTVVGPDGKTTEESACKELTK